MMRIGHEGGVACQAPIFRGVLMTGEKEMIGDDEYIGPSLWDSDPVAKSEVVL